MTGRSSQVSAHGARRVDLEGPYGRIAALRADPPVGAPTAGTVLLVPGYTGSKEDFAPLLDGIADAGLAVVAIDQPGQYESPGPKDEAQYLPEALGKVVADLVRTLAAEERPVLLLGHSYGGLVSRAAVLAGAPVAGLTLLDSGPHRLTDRNRLLVLDFAEPVLRAHGLEQTYTLREQLNVGNPAWTAAPDELKAFLRARFVGSHPSALLGMARGLQTEPDRVAELRTLLEREGTPSLVVTGENDDAWSVAEQRDMADRLGAPFVLIPGAGHSPNIETPDVLLGELLPAWGSWLTS
ncbi:alpha/beta hydrolase [Amycolatopsis antarctica]|uniref:Alpha/beta hydrolase n=1 Tax=Amycolatopsis antarctica TaxID=1854586 RepID=A0A263DCD4_9PSEU|nr:alpha/beta hydrolase [Amycolatopsis antarctica]OZM75156.1 alpha/beta hydrolase [Amycolatopsis antarctica]